MARNKLPTIENFLNSLTKTNSANLQDVQIGLKTIAPFILVPNLFTLPTDKITLLGHDSHTSGICRCNRLDVLKTVCEHFKQPAWTVKKILTTPNVFGISYSDAAFGTMNLEIVKFLIKEVKVGAAHRGFLDSNILLFSAVNGHRDVFIYLTKKFPSLLFEANAEGKHPLMEFLMCEVRAGNHKNIENLLKEIPVFTIDGIQFTIHELLLRMVFKPSPTTCENPMHNALEFFADDQRNNPQNFANLLHFFAENFEEFLTQRDRRGRTPLHKALELNANFATAIILARPSILLANEMQDVQSEMVDALESLTAEQKVKFKPKIFELFFNAIRENKLENTKFLINIVKNIYPDLVDKKSAEKKELKNLFFTKIKEHNDDIVIAIAEVWPSLLTETYSNAEMVAEKPINDPFKLALVENEEELWNKMHRIHRNNFETDPKYQLTKEEGRLMRDLRHSKPCALTSVSAQPMSGAKGNEHE